MLEFFLDSNYHNYKRGKYSKIHHFIFICKISCWSTVFGAVVMKHSERAWVNRWKMSFKLLQRITNWFLWWSQHSVVSMSDFLLLFESYLFPLQASACRDAHLKVKKTKQNKVQPTKTNNQTHTHTHCTRWIKPDKFVSTLALLCKGLMSPNLHTSPTRQKLHRPEMIWKVQQTSHELTELSFTRQ